MQMFQDANLLQPIRSTTQIWVVTCHLHLLLRHHFMRKPVATLPNFGCFLRLLELQCSWHPSRIWYPTSKCARVAAAAITVEGDSFKLRWQYYLFYRWQHLGTRLLECGMLIVINAWLCSKAIAAVWNLWTSEKMKYVSTMDWCQCFFYVGG